MSQDNPGENGWKEWANYVLNELKRLAELTSKIPLMEKDIAILQLKAGVWGALAGVVVTLGTILLLFFKK